MKGGIEKPAAPGTVTNWLRDWQRGSPRAGDEAMLRMYEELRGIAAKVLSGERSDHTLETSALVHEAYFRLAGQVGVKWRNRVHFLSLAARMMRRILVDHARRHAAVRRGGGAITLGLDRAADRVGADEYPIEVLALHQALELLERRDASLAKLVELRFFGGLENREIAEVLEVSTMTVLRRWRLARAWLYRHLAGV